MRPISVHAAIGPWEFAFAFGPRDDEESASTGSAVAETERTPIGFGWEPGELEDAKTRRPI